MNRRLSAFQGTTSSQPWAELNILGQFSWETENPVVARKHFCNEVWGWLSSTGLCRDNKFMGTRRFLNIEESIAVAHYQKGASLFIYVLCLLMYAGSWNNLSSKTVKTFFLWSNFTNILWLYKKNLLFHTLHDSNFVFFHISDLENCSKILHLCFSLPYPVCCVSKLHH